MHLAYKGLKNIYLKVSDRLEEADKLEKEKLSIAQAVTPYRFPSSTRPPMINAPFLEQQAKKMILQQQQSKPSSSE